MYEDVKTAFETMIQMAHDCECVRELGSNPPMEGLDEANSFVVEGGTEGRYRVTVESEGKRCVAEKRNEIIEVIEGSENDFMNFCEEFTLAW